MPNRLQKKHFAIANVLILAGCGLVSARPAYALFSWFDPPKAQQQQMQKQRDALKPASDEPTLQLVDQIAHQPELMNLRYLNYVLGPATADGCNTFGTVLRYYWYDPTTSMQKYELVQRQSSPGRIFQSTFTASMPNLKKDLADVESKFGTAPTKYFDQTASPNIKYEYVPNTTVAYKQPQDQFYVSQGVVDFFGGTSEYLPPLSAVALNQAIDMHRANAFEQDKNGNWSRAIPALRQRVAENPRDFEARMALAKAYKEHSNLNEAITEYRTVLMQSPDPQTAQQCIQALQDMRVLPGPNGPPQRVELTLQHHGQGFHAGDVASNPPPQAATTASAPLNIAPLDPPSLSPGYQMDPKAGF